MLPRTQQASVPAMIKFVRINWALMCNNSPRPCYCSIRHVIEYTSGSIVWTSSVNSQFLSYSWAEIKLELYVCLVKSKLLGQDKSASFRFLQDDRQQMVYIPHYKSPVFLLILHLQMWCFLHTKTGGIIFACLYLHTVIIIWQKLVCYTDWAL